MRNCVTVALQTLTLFVWVRILVPQPKKTGHHSMVCFLSLSAESVLSHPVLEKCKAFRKHGFAFERKPVGSSLTNGEAKNIRAKREYPAFRSLHASLFRTLAISSVLARWGSMPQGRVFFIRKIANPTSQLAGKSAKIYRLGLLKGYAYPINLHRSCHLYEKILLTVSRFGGYRVAVLRGYLHGYLRHRYLVFVRSYNILRR